MLAERLQLRLRLTTATRAIVGVAALAAAHGVAAAERSLVLEVMLNGRPIGLVAEFTERDGTLAATPAELRAIGLAVPAALLGGDDKPFPLPALPGVTARLEERTQRVHIAAEPSALRSTVLNRPDAPADASVPLTPPALGAVLNYDVLGTLNQSRSLGSGLLDLRVFSGIGVVSSGVLAYSERPSQDQDQVVRLDTTWTYADPEATRRWRAGDLVGGGLSWTRPVRLGGAQVQTDFTLQPDLITFPLPSLEGVAAVPSTVDVLVNGVRRLSREVDPGPFEVRQLPVVTGAGEIALAVRDALGRQTITMLPFYASSAMLAPGLSTYSLEAGLVRRRFALVGEDYGAPATSGSLRHGASDRLTLEAHMEASTDVVAGGAGALLRLGSLGVLSTAVAGSSDLQGEGGGLFWQAGLERASAGLSLGLTASGATPSYRDIAAENGSPFPRSTLRAGVEFSLGDYGSLGAAYIEQRGGRDDRDGGSSDTDVRLASATYSLTLTRNLHLHASGFKDLGEDGGFGGTIGLTLALGRTSGSGSVTTDDARDATAIVQAHRPALVPGELGFRASAAEGHLQHRIVEGEYFGDWGRLSAGIDESAGSVAGRTGMRGAVTLAGGGLFLSDTVHDSFAVVRTGEVGDVGVLYENRPVGRTGKSGRLLVPYLRSYEANSLALDPKDLPVDAEADATRMRVRPPDRAGVVVDFGVRRPAAALLRLHDVAGRPIPVGSSARLAGGSSAAVFPVGHDGEVFAMELRSTNVLEVTTPDGAVCHARFDYRRVPNELPTIGPLPCRRQVE